MKWLCLILLIAIGVGVVLADYYKATPADGERRYVGRAACVDCHREEAKLFRGSHHDLAMDLATEKTVLGDFSGVELEHFGLTSKFFRDGKKFLVHTEGPDGVMTDFEIKYVFGVDPLQQYMIELRRSPNAASDEIGQVQVLRLSWDTHNKKWFYLSPPDVDSKLTPGDPLHWTGITQRWNSSCAACHSTDLQRHFDPKSGHYLTTFAEIDVSCEACHGPGSLHVELAKNKGIFWDREHGFGLDQLKATSNVPQVEKCGACHSRRTEICNGQVAKGLGGDNVHDSGTRFDDFHALQLLSKRIYHDDGQIRDEDYVYGSFIQSKMFHKGIRCTDCHDPHSTKLKYDDNQLCTSCHQHPAGKYDSPNHHHHEPGTPGASCVACHMPETTYMELDARRDHSFRVPRPDLSVKFGTPNACTGCHLDAKAVPDSKPNELTQYLDWINLRDDGNKAIDEELKRVDQQMLAAVEKWYPEGSNDTPKSEYYALLAEGKSSSANAIPTLRELALDRKSPGIFRASAMAELIDDPNVKTLEVAKKALGDPDPKVVAVALGRIESEMLRLLGLAQYKAARSKSISPVEDLTELVAELCDHPSRRVRVEVARVLTTVPSHIRSGCLGPERRSAYDRCLAEFKDSLQVENDRASSHLQLSWIYELGGDVKEAARAMRTAIRVQPELAGPRSSLAVLMEGEAQFISRNLQQSSGQIGDVQQEIKRVQTLIAEAKKLRAEDHELLGEDIKRAEGLADMHALEYRYGMSCYLQDDLKNAEKFLLRAYSQQQSVPTYVLALATFYQQQEKLDLAAKYASQLREIEPENPGYKRLSEEILAAMQKEKPKQK